MRTVKFLKDLLKSRKFIISFIVLMAYMGVILYLSSLPGDLLNPEKEFGFNIDASVKHFVEFSVLGVLIANIFWQLARNTVLNRRLLTFSGSSVFSAFYGVLDEFHQFFVPTRYCTVFDALVDTAGSITGVLIFLFCVHIVKG